MPCPVLVMAGRRDFIWPPRLGRWVATLLPDVTFLELADAGHVPHLHTPEVLTDAALRFLSRTSP